MELPCLPAETPTTASSTSTDPLYDNYCPPFAPHRGRERDGVLGRQRLAVTGLPAPCNPVAGRAPTVPEVPTLGGGRGGPGFWPDHSYCSWGGGLGTQGWDAELRVNRTGGGGGGGGRIDGGQGRERSTSPPQSEEHESALSVYDNLHGAVTPDNLLEGMAMETSFQDDTQRRQHVTGQIQQMMMEADGVSGESSTWSSCEILLGENTGSTDADKMQEMVPEQQPELDMEVPRLSSHHLPTSAAASPPHPSQGGLQAQGPLPVAPHPEELPQQGPRVPPPLPLADPSASAIRSILTNLQQQIGRQREDYEIRIYSLEQRNEELLMEVVGLRANLAQQKRWYQVVQAKIAESEELRATAELHNAALQRELEQFFDTFGELNNEAKKTECIVRSF